MLNKLFYNKFNINSLTYTNHKILVMKKIKKFLFCSVLFCSVLLLNSCSEPTNDIIPEQQSTKNLTQLKKEAITRILSMSNDSEFKSFILTECLKQSHGDYNVYFSTIIEKYKSKNIEFANSLSVLRLNMMKINGGIEPLLFYPQAETIENIAYKKTFRTSNGEPVVIGIYDSDLSPSYTASGYIIQNDGTLQYHSEITEDFAWENDVWVIGLEEDTNDYSLSYTDLPSFIPVAVNTSLRTQGQAEYAAIIQVTDLNDIEPWTGGKLEFTIVVMNANGVIIGNEKFPKRKRSNFKDNKWYDYNYFVGNWNTSTFGNWMYEKWIERDGGKSASITVSVPPPAGSSGPTTTINIPSEDRDDDLGLATIQFSDNIDQVYNISYANIKRRK